MNEVSFIIRAKSLQSISGEWIQETKDNWLYRHLCHMEITGQQGISEILKCFECRYSVAGRRVLRACTHMTGRLEEGRYEPRVASWSPRPRGANGETGPIKQQVGLFISGRL